MYGIRCKQTGLFMKLNVDLEWRGRDYMQYQEAVFTLEQPNQYNEKSPVWITQSKEIAEQVLNSPKRTEGTIFIPAFSSIERNSYENHEYEVVEVQDKPLLKCE